MLNKTQLDEFPVCHLALELVPEAFARNYCVLAVSVLNDNLHLIVPTNARELITAYGDTFDRIRMLLDGRNFTYDFADPSDLQSTIDLHYRAAYSEIRNCDAKFSLQCPKQWTQLAQTPKSTVRFCNQCNQRVYFCLTDKELAQRISEKQCVAFYDHESEDMLLGLLECPED